MGDEAAVLLSAVSSLAPFAPPDRVVRTLRRALVELLEPPAVPVTGALREDLRSRSRRRHARPPSLEAWLPVRDRVLAELAASGTSRRELANQLGIALSTLKSVLLPHCRAPGAANLAKLRRWLERRPAPAAPSGSAAPQHNGDGTQQVLLAKARQTGPDATTTDTGQGKSLHAASEAPDLIRGIPTPTKLTVAQREKLAGYRQLDERTMRKAAGVTAEVVADAVAGRSLAPELVGRLVGFLEQQQPAAE